MRTLAISLLLSAGLLIQSVGTALAHHGWAWTTGGNVDLSGTIKSAKLGNPHGVLQVDINGDLWTVEVGQPWRNERAGIKPGMLAEGVDVRIVGEPSVNIEDRLVKAERVYIDGVEYVLYPNRD